MRMATVSLEATSVEVATPLAELETPAVELGAALKTLFCMTFPVAGAPWASRSGFAVSALALAHMAASVKAGSPKIIRDRRIRFLLGGDPPERSRPAEKISEATIQLRRSIDYNRRDRGSGEPPGRGSGMELTDASLVSAARAGHRDAYDELVRRHAAGVMAVVCARLGRTGPLEDLVQESFLRALQSLGSLAEPEKFAAWLRGIATHACLDWLKSKSRKHVALDGGYDAPAPESEEDERGRAILDAVEDLDEIHREVVTMCYFEKASYKEMSARLGITTAGVNARLQRARALLRDALLAREREPGSKRARSGAP
jgi:RNA polymerase sigma-70 factor (ECF subfamily)